MTRRRKRSEELAEQAARLMPGGVNSPERSFAAAGLPLLFGRRGQGAVVYDQDDNAYTDYRLSGGALICGHAHRNVVLAAKKACERGLSLGLTTQAETDLARYITASFPAMAQVRFVNSGTEAVLAALRLARAATGRPLVIKFDGSCHGMVDEFLSGPREDNTATVIRLPYNDPEAFEKAVAGAAGRVAAVLVEPVRTAGGVVPADRPFLAGLRLVTRQHGILLIFDEVTTGFRRERGGAQTALGLDPDLTCLGKIIGGGLPVGAIGGKKEFLRLLAPAGPVPLSGTFSGNPVVMRAGLATLKLLNEDIYRSLNGRADAFAGRLREFFAAKRIPAAIAHYGPMFGLRFLPAPGAKSARADRGEQNKTDIALFKYLMQNNILWPSGPGEPFYFSAAHRPRDLQTLAAAIESFFAPQP
jgi:glutamate-1-semialdehyde 2,1-aminomutase